MSAVPTSASSFQWAHCPIHVATLRVLDVETTGLYPTRGARLTEIAVVDGREDTRRVGGATDVHFEWRRDDGPLDAVWPTLMDALRETVIVGHHLAFDLRFLAVTADRLGHAGPRLRYVDTLPLARRLVDDVPNHTLETLLHRLGGAPDGPLHTALVDARATRRLFWRLVDDGSLHTLADAGLTPLHWATF